MGLAPLHAPVAPGRGYALPWQTTTTLSFHSPLPFLSTSKAGTSMALPVGFFTVTTYSPTPLGLVNLFSTLGLTGTTVTSAAVPTFSVGLPLRPHRSPLPFPSQAPFSLAFGREAQGDRSFV